MKRIYHGIKWSIIILLMTGSLFHTYAEVSAGSFIKNLFTQNEFDSVDDTYIQDAIKHQKKIVILDAREKANYQKAHIPTSISLPVRRFDKVYKEVMQNIPKDREIIVYCDGSACHKSQVLAKKLSHEGHSNIKIYTDGLPDWVRAGHKLDFDKVTRVKKTAKPSKSSPKQTGKMKPGMDEGSVDGKWFVANFKQLQKDIKVIDVRTQKEFATGHLKGARNIPLEGATARKYAMAVTPGAEIVFVCSNGFRAMQAWMMLKESGFPYMNRVWYFDAQIQCTKSKPCSVVLNEPIGE